MQIITSLFKKTLVWVLLSISVLSSDLISNPGDTSWVTVFNKRWLDHYGNYDTTATFPTGKRYRKIRMHYILGRYACPGNPQYCGSWDYTTQIYARHAGMDSVEIARVITPYATDWLNKNKSHDYITEVTDFATALEGNTGFRFHYSGYSWGFTITLKLEFIEGVPPMDELSVRNIYDGYFTYGNSTLSIENNLTAKTYSYANTVNKTFIRNTVSGHGSDATGCGEFCSKYYQQKINGNIIGQKQLWRADCGINEVYPQTGTWIYDRANWCPGAVVWPLFHDISQVTSANTNFTVDVDMQSYTIASATGGYNWVSQLINYSAPNHSLDVSIEDIVSPNTDPNYFRENPSCASPSIRIKNVGTNSVTSVIFNYGLQTGASSSYTWTGNLNFLDTATVFFPPSTSIMSATAASIFSVNIDKVNGISDQNNFNNIYQSKFTPVIAYPDTIVVKLLTNKSTDAITGFNETTWKLYDENGTVIASRSNCNNQVLYKDTIILLPGCYKFSLNDSGCDGTDWWANAAAGAGSCRFERRTGGYPFFTSPVDFGCNFVKSFRVLPRIPINTTSLTQNIPLLNVVEVFPSPASNIAYVRFDLTKSQNITYKLTDLTGKIIFEKSLYNISAIDEEIDLSKYYAGIYIFSTYLSDGSVINKKLVIQN